MKWKTFFVKIWWKKEIVMVYLSQIMPSCVNLNLSSPKMWAKFTHIHFSSPKIWAKNEPRSWVNWKKDHSHSHLPSSVTNWPHWLWFVIIIFLEWHSFWTFANCESLVWIPRTYEFVILWNHKEDRTISIAYIWHFVRYILALEVNLIVQFWKKVGFGINKNLFLFHFPEFHKLD